MTAKRNVSGWLRTLVLAGLGPALLAGLSHTQVRAEQLYSEILWSRSADGVLWGCDVAVGADFRPVILESVAGEAGSSLHVTKLDELTGLVVWTVPLALEQPTDSSRVSIGPDNNPVVLAQCATGTENDFMLIKLQGTDGTPLWSAGLGLRPEVDFWDIAVGADTNPVVVGMILANDGSDNVARKYDGTSGMQLWEVAIDIGSDDILTGVAVGPDNHPVLLGTSWTESGSELRVLKLHSASGEVLWNTPLAEHAREFSYAVAVGTDGNVYATGEYHIPLSDGQLSLSGLEPVLAKFNGSSGERLWSVVPEHESGGSFQADVDVGPDGNPIVAGDLAAKYDGATGALLCVLDYGNRVEVGGDGNPVLTGSSTAKYVFAYGAPPEGPLEPPTRVFLNGTNVCVMGSWTGPWSASLVMSGSGEPPPSDFGFGWSPTYYYIETTAGYGTLTIVIRYDESQYSGNESELRLFHYENGAWVDCTTSVDVERNLISGQVTSLSPFAVGEPLRQPVDIDIKPGSPTNTINVRSQGVIPVAILSGRRFDATTVNPGTVKLARASVRLRGDGRAMASFSDVNQDGLLDLLVHIEARDLVLAPQDIEAVLEAETYDGKRVRGSDSVRVLP